MIEMNLKLRTRRADIQYECDGCPVANEANHPNVEAALEDEESHIRRQKQSLQADYLLRSVVLQQGDAGEPWSHVICTYEAMSKYF